MIGQWYGLGETSAWNHGLDYGVASDSANQSLEREIITCKIQPVAVHVLSVQTALTAYQKIYVEAFGSNLSTVPKR